MTKLPTFKYIVEYKCEVGVFKSRFTNEKHARNFLKSQKKEKVTDLKLFEIDAEGNRIKEIKVR